jgi:hypothetical protein
MTAGPNTLMNARVPVDGTIITGVGSDPAVALTSRHRFANALPGGSVEQLDNAGP